MAKYLESSVKFHHLPLFHVVEDKDGMDIVFPPGDARLHTVTPQCVYVEDKTMSIIDVYVSLARNKIFILDDAGYGSGAYKFISGGYLNPTTRMQDEELGYLLADHACQDFETVLELIQDPE